MTYSPNNKTITDLIEWALQHGYNPYTSIVSLPERRDRFYKAYIAISVASPDLLALAQTIAQLKQDGEEDENGNAWVMENDDAIDTLNELITTARRILK